MVKTRLVESSHSIVKTAAVGHTPPEFTRLFRDTRVRPGEPCTLEVAIAANPPPTVSVSTSLELDFKSFIRHKWQQNKKEDFLIGWVLTLAKAKTMTTKWIDVM